MRKRSGEVPFHVVNFGALAVFSIFCLIPFLSVIGTSLTSQAEWARKGAFVLFPEAPVLDAYQTLLATRGLVFHGMAVSVLRITVGTCCNMAVTILLAYALSKRFLGRTAITLAVFFTMVFSGGLIPLYMLVAKVGLINSFWALVLPNLVNAWWMLIMRNFFMELPRDFEEAAIMDGASISYIIVRIVLPLSTAAIATIGLFYAVYHWNEWFQAFIFISEPRKLPLQNRLRSILIRGLLDEAEAMIDLRTMPPAQSLKTAMIVITTVPILCVYPFIQKYFVQGVRLGGIKG
jgi:putative aldouronate transport system permease protein